MGKQLTPCRRSRSSRRNKATGGVFCLCRALWLLRSSLDRSLPLARLESGGVHLIWAVQLIIKYLSCYASSGKVSSMFRHLKWSLQSCPWFCPTQIYAQVALDILPTSQSLSQFIQAWAPDNLPSKSAAPAGLSMKSTPMKEVHYRY